MQDIEFTTTNDLAPEELRAFYERQGIHTTSSEERLRRMLQHTYCFVTARQNGEMIGLARGVTDGMWGRLAECKLDPRFQGPACLSRTGGRIEHDATGIARQMAQRVIDALRDYGVEKIDAVAYGTEVDFCEELGFRRVSGVVALEWLA